MDFDDYLKIRGLQALERESNSNGEMGCAGWLVIIFVVAPAVIMFGFYAIMLLYAVIVGLIEWNFK